MGETEQVLSYQQLWEQAKDLRAQLQQAQENLREHDRLKGELNKVLHPKGDGPATPSWCDLIAFVAGDREQAQQAARTLVYQRHMARLSQGWWYRRFGEVQEWAEAAAALVEKLRKAGVSDYSTFFGLNRVDCHFCPSSWRADGPPKHKKGCPLAPAEALRARSPQSGQEGGAGN